MRIERAPRPSLARHVALAREALRHGDSGILLAAWLLEPADDLADLLYARVRENAGSETNEWEAGSPGTMIAARALLERTGEARWAEAWRESAEILWQRREPDGFWVYPPYGKAPGAGHGVAVNATILLARGDLFPTAGARRWWAAPPLPSPTLLCARASSRTGRWKPPTPSSNGRVRSGCSGATAAPASSRARRRSSTRSCCSPEPTSSGTPVRRAWRRGRASATAPPETATPFRTFGRTGDERWLRRARRFAVHALGQVERWRERRGGGRHSLWAGDLGAALFAADCLDARAEHPLLDYL
jgi:hypothetical protein